MGYKASILKIGPRRIRRILSVLPKNSFSTIWNMMHLILAGLLLLSTGNNHCLGKLILSCPRDESGNEINGGFSIDGINGCGCRKVPGDPTVVVWRTLMWYENWERGICHMDYYTDPCNLCKCVGGRCQYTKKKCPYTFGPDFAHPLEVPFSRLKA